MNHVRAVALFDLDNCLANDAWRIPLIRWDLPKEAGRYDAYHAACGRDPVYPVAWELYRAAVRDGKLPIFVTGRPERVREETVDWLKRNIVDAHKTLHIEMRGDTDHRSSVHVKRDAVCRIIRDNVQITDAYDDHEGILAMYRDEFNIQGIHLVRAHKRTAYHEEEPAPIAELGPSRREKDVEPTVAVIEPARAPELLERGAATFRERASIYGDNYLALGEALLALFPGRTIPAITTPDEANRLHLLVQIMTKMSRFAQSFAAGGHLDSAHDAMVYAAMLEEVMRRERAR